MAGFYRTFAPDSHIFNQHRLFSNKLFAASKTLEEKTGIKIAGVENQKDTTTTIAELTINTLEQNAAIQGLLYFTGNIIFI